MQHSPLTTLEVFAVQTHEVFDAFINAGFTEAQALQLVGMLMQINTFEDRGY